MTYDRVEVPGISMEDFFNDAFRPIARDGAGNIEVMLRLQKAFKAIETINNEAMKESVIRNSKEAYKRAEKAIKFKQDLDTLYKNCLFKKE
nr:hypothetical protein [Muriicola soli]